MTNVKENTATKLSYLLVGGGIGAILALLFAPKAGQEFRADIADVTRKGLDKTEEMATQLNDKAQTVYSDTKSKAVEIYDTAKQKLNTATAAISEIPADLQNAVHDKVEQISSSIEAGKNEYNRELGQLNEKAKSKTV